MIKSTNTAKAADVNTSVWYYSGKTEQTPMRNIIVLIVAFSSRLSSLNRCTAEDLCLRARRAKLLPSSDLQCLFKVNVGSRG